ncbi:MAG TPA: hypothetical protein PKX93_04110 [bacterium]|nr:hypothetical protein [bacterium]HOL66625.1 hypothetical protein [bacterium]HPP11267.1 hypothetical protein [bacterium]
MHRAILKDWHPEEVIVKEREASRLYRYVLSLPGDVKLLQREYWRRPKNYGWVKKV